MIQGMVENFYHVSLSKIPINHLPTEWRYREYEIGMLSCKIGIYLVSTCFKKEILHDNHTNNSPQVTIV